jgi:hypothetical protein
VLYQTVNFKELFNARNVSITTTSLEVIQEDSTGKSTRYKARESGTQFIVN